MRFQNFHLCVSLSYTPSPANPTPTLRLVEVVQP